MRVVENLLENAIRYGKEKGTDKTPAEAVGGAIAAAVMALLDFRTALTFGEMMGVSDQGRARSRDQRECRQRAWRSISWNISV